MLKNIMLILIGAFIAVLVLGLVGFAYAQTQTPPNGYSPDGGCPAGMGRWKGGGMMGRWYQSSSMGLMHETFLAAIAPKLGISVDALKAELASGKTLWQIAAAKGISDEQMRDLWLEAKKVALTKMVSEGVITQAQADWMLSRMEWMFQNGRGFGGGMGICHGGSWQGRGGRWSPTPTPEGGSQP